MKTQENKPGTNQKPKTITYYQEQPDFINYGLDELLDDYILQDANLMIIGNREYKKYCFSNNEKIQDFWQDYYAYNFNADETIQELKELTNKDFEYCYIRGYCQRDWQLLFFEKNTLTKKDIDFIECVYFCKCDEFYPDPDENDDLYPVITILECDIDYKNYNDSIKSYIADEIGFEKENIRLAFIDSYKTIPVYKYE